jgi:ABC-type Fe3+-siderophore transport system permease subunit
MPWVLLFGVIAFIGAIFPTAAYAYIDPGTGSLLVQAAIASVLTLGAAIKSQSQRFKGFLNSLVRRFRR